MIEVVRRALRALLAGAGPSEECPKGIDERSWGDEP
jgi:hypothetical protein